jgi:hypothetical protein
MLIEERKPSQIHLWLVIFLVCLLFTFVIWDRFFNSPDPLDQQLASNLILVMGILFSLSASLFAWSIESSRNRLEVRVRERTEELEKRNAELETALREIKTLRGLIPICASCKKIRTDDGLWEKVEVYLEEHSEARFSHGLCRECAKKVYLEFQAQKEKGKS